MSLELPDTGSCVFCSIVAGDTEAIWEARPVENARVACFQNQLKWARVMLLIVPTEHLTQTQLWSSEVLIEAAKLAVEMGEKYCGDEGFRLISNFGLQAHQSQVHGHIHLVSGTSFQIKNAHYASRLSIDGIEENLVIDEFDVDEVPFAARISPAVAVKQREMWCSGQILDTSIAALETTRQNSPDGFRLMSSFEPAADNRLAGENEANLFLLGGGQLGLYV